MYLTRYRFSKAFINYCLCLLNENDRMRNHWKREKYISSHRFHWKHIPFTIHSFLVSDEQQTKILPTNASFTGSIKPNASSDIAIGNFLTVPGQNSRTLSISTGNIVSTRNNSFKFIHSVLNTQTQVYRVPTTD